MTKHDTPPIACTLTGSDFQARLAAIAELARQSLRDYWRHDLELSLTYAPDAAARVRDMVRNERACCAFLAFDLREKPQEIVLTITAPEDARELAVALFGQFVGDGKCDPDDDLARVLKLRDASPFWAWLRLLIIPRG
jgi:hypothetical protein